MRKYVNEYKMVSTYTYAMNYGKFIVNKLGKYDSFVIQRQFNNLWLIQFYNFEK